MQHVSETNANKLFDKIIKFSNCLHNSINSEQAGRPKCPLDPFFIMADKCKCVDFQTFKLQELPDFVPQGEIPRHMQLFCDRSLVNNNI